MKTNLKFLFFAVIISGTFAWSSCKNSSNDPTATEDKKSSEERNDAKFDGKAEKDAQFAVEAADINLAEMSLGQLASTNAISDDTRELGSMMNKDHKKAYDDLAALASKKTITIPSTMSEASQKDYDKLSQKKGADFDKAYCDMMVDGHKDAISKFEKASKDAVDPDIQAWATNMLPSLRTHLDHAMTCQEKSKNLK